MEKESASSSTAEVLERLQNETQRVRNRLSPAKPSDPEDPPQLSSIEQPIEYHFEDPIPPQIMSGRLQNEDEAFRAKYVSLLFL